jgi:hypothetical protein
MIHTEILTSVQREVLARVAPAATAENFYLGGWTAIALHLGHRRSVDFDWFTPAPFEPFALAGTLRTRAPGMTVRSQDRGTLHAAESDVLVSFLQYEYPLLQPLIAWPEYECSLASLADLACMKLAAIGNRGARKDFVDVHALVHSGFALEEMLSAYQRRYETQDVGHVLFSLNYFDDAEVEDMPEMLWPVRWDAIKTDVRRWVKELS